MVNDPTEGIVWSLKRLFDTPEQIEGERRERAATLRGQRRAQGDPPGYRCRVCAYESLAPEFCPDCLADTMVRVERTALAAARPGIEGKV